MRLSLAPDGWPRCKKGHSQVQDNIYLERGKRRCLVCYQNKMRRLPPSLHRRIKLYKRLNRIGFRPGSRVVDSRVAAAAHGGPESYCD